MKEPFMEKIKRALHGTFLFPHKLHVAPFSSGVDDDGQVWGKGFYLLWCTCGYSRKQEKLETNQH